MKKTNTKHRFVARLLAFGHDLKDVCDVYGLNFVTWRQISCDPIFKAAVREIEDELTDRMIEDAIEDLKN